MMYLFLLITFILFFFFNHFLRTIKNTVYETVLERIERINSSTNTVNATFSVCQPKKKTIIYSKQKLCNQVIFIAISDIVARMYHISSF